MNLNPIELYFQTHLYPLYTKMWVERFRKLKQGDVVVDAGAFWGGFATYAGRRVGKRGRIISFEPDPVNFSVLRMKVLKSGLGNVALVNKALGDLSRKIEFESSKHFSSAVIKRGDNPKCLVEQTTLDRVLGELGVRRVNVLKVNIEGSEVGAILGANKTLKNTEYVAISSHEIGGKHTAYDIEPMLKKYGFKTRLVRRTFRFTGHVDLYGFR